MSAWAHVTWYTARAGGYTAFLLLTASVCLGLALSFKLASPRWPRFLTTELHRYVTLTAIGFAVLHGLALWADPWEAFPVSALVVPMDSHYRPLAVALGIVSLYLAIALWLSSRIQRRIGYPTWRRLHYLTYAVFALAATHTILAGEDAHTAWGRGIDWGAVALVAGLTVLRIGYGRRGRQRHAARTVRAGASA